MRDTTFNQRSEQPLKPKYAKYSKSSRHRRIVCESVVGWPIDKAIPKKLADWLAFLLRYRILEEVQLLMKNGDVLMVRYNLAGFQRERTDITPLFSVYTQVILIQRVGDESEKSFNVWVDGKLTAMIRQGNAYGKNILEKQYNRMVYNASRITADLESDLIESVKLFPHAPRHILWVSDASCQL